MNKNSYVTAALFVVFVLLTVVYFNLDTPSPDPLVGGLGNLETPLVGDLLNSAPEGEEGETPETGEETAETSDLVQEGQEDNTGQEAPAPGAQTPAPGAEAPQAEEGQAPQGEVPAPEGQGENVGPQLGAAQTTSAVATLRDSLERDRSARTSSLHSIIASADHSAETKSEAMDQLTALDQSETSRRVVETAIRAMGFSDVVVQPNEATESVIVTVEIESLDHEPSLDLVAEMMLLTSQQFGRRNHVSVNFKPVN